MSKEIDELTFDDEIKMWQAGYANLITERIDDMSDEEFNGLLTIAMTKEEKSIIEKYGWVFCRRYTSHDFNIEELKVYSMGGKPFKIKITEHELQPNKNKVQ